MYVSKYGFHLILWTFPIFLRLCAFTLLVTCFLCQSESYLNFRYRANITTYIKYSLMPIAVGILPSFKCLSLFVHSFTDTHIQPRIVFILVLFYFLLNWKHLKAQTMLSTLISSIPLEVLFTLQKPGDFIWTELVILYTIYCVELCLSCFGYIQDIFYNIYKIFFKKEWRIREKLEKFLSNVHT